MIDLTHGWKLVLMVRNFCNQIFNSSARRLWEYFQMLAILSQVVVRVWLFVNWKAFSQMEEVGSNNLLWSLTFKCRSHFFSRVFFILEHVRISKAIRLNLTNQVLTRQWDVGLFSSGLRSFNVSKRHNILNGLHGVIVGVVDRSRLRKLKFSHYPAKIGVRELLTCFSFSSLCTTWVHGLNERLGALL